MGNNKILEFKVADWSSIKKDLKHNKKSLCILTLIFLTLTIIISLVISFVESISFCSAFINCISLTFFTPYKLELSELAQKLMIIHGVVSFLFQGIFIALLVLAFQSDTVVKENSSINDKSKTDIAKDSLSKLYDKIISAIEKDRINVEIDNRMTHRRPHIHIDIFLD